MRPRILALLAGLALIAFGAVPARSEDSGPIRLASIFALTGTAIRSSPRSS